MPNNGHQVLKEINSPKRSRKKQSKKASIAKVRRFITTLVLLIFVIPNVCTKTINTTVINRIKYASIQLPNDEIYFRSAEKPLINDNLFDPAKKSVVTLDSPFNTNNEFNMPLLTARIGEVNFDKPLMQKPELKAEMPLLTARLKNLASTYPMLTPGIFVWDYQTGAFVNINADKEFPTASIIKLPLLHQLFRRVESGQIDLNDIMKLTEYYRTPGSGFIQCKAEGTVFTMKKLAEEMIQESDNSATNMILASVGGVDQMNRNMRDWGFSSSHMSNWLPDLDGTNVATPMDMGTMLYNIDNDSFHTLSSTLTMTDIMSHVKNRFLIQSSLPDGAAFIHKTGDIGNMLGDAGIVTLPDNRKYIVVMMVKRPWNSYMAKQFIIDAAKTVYNSYASNSL